MRPPRTHYARNGEVNIAYQVLGDGPIDLIHVPPFVSNLELQWEDRDRASAGAGLKFEDRGEHTLKGLGRPWRLHAVLA